MLTPLRSVCMNSSAKGDISRVMNEHFACTLQNIEGKDEVLKLYFRFLFLRFVDEELLSFLPMSMAKLEQCIVGTKQLLDSMLLLGD